MKPEPKLLVSPWSNEVSNVNDLQGSTENNKPNVDSETLSEEEAKMLDLLLKKSKKKPRRNKQSKKNT